MDGHTQWVAEPPSAIEQDGEELPQLSPGVGCDSTAQGNKVRNLPSRSATIMI